MKKINSIRASLYYVHMLSRQASWSFICNNNTMGSLCFPTYKLISGSTETDKIMMYYFFHCVTTKKRLNVLVDFTPLPMASNV